MSQKSLLQTIEQFAKDGYYVGVGHSEDEQHEQILEVYIGWDRASGFANATNGFALDQEPAAVEWLHTMRARHEAGEI